MNTTPHQEHILHAPLSGMLVPLSAVADPVFAEKMIGDGVAIAPASNTLRAPCNGTVTHIHSACHALTLTTPDGIEILMHIGLDTVELKGQGFTVHVQQGDTVVTGDALIEFDDAFVAKHARSLITPIIILSSDKITSIESASGHVVAGKDRILTLNQKQEGSRFAADTPIAAKLLIESNEITVKDHSGLHARPAALIANTAKMFESTIHLLCKGNSANAKSVVAILGLNVQEGDSVRLTAEGVDAQDAIAHLTPLFNHHKTFDAQTGTHIKPQTAKLDMADGVLRGIGASSGLAAGYIYHLNQHTITPVETGAGEQAERQALHTALTEAHIQLEQLKYQVHGQSASGHAEIFSAHQELLEDPELLDEVMAAIAHGQSAAFAWKKAMTHQADRLSNLANPLLAARSNDLQDVGLRVLQLLTGSNTMPMQIPANSIIIAEELTPSLTVSLDRSKVLGLCTCLGSPTSHVAILARSLDIPAVVGIERQALSLAEGMPVILDGSQGLLRLNPSEQELSALRIEQQRNAQQHANELLHANEPAYTTDQHPIPVLANINGLQEIGQGLEQGAEGVGLLRSEFLFMQRSDAPGEAEQTDAYISIARQIGPHRPLVIRTLDVGGDKPLTYIPLPSETNPFLGIRGVRLSLQQEGLFRTQLRAILRAAPYTKLCVMFPMIATLDELRACKKILKEERQALNVPPIEVGIMIEVPSAAVLAKQFAREVDFFSIGTNDLTQYVLAMDRNHPGLGQHTDAFDPAVLQLIANTVDAAHTAGKWVGLCGGLASEPLAIPVLIGLGIDELSVSAPSIPKIKALIRTLNKTQCNALATKVLTLSTSKEVREYLLNQKRAENKEQKSEAGITQTHDVSI